MCPLGTYAVVDLSEGGMRCEIERAAFPEEGAELTGEIRVRRGETVHVKATVLRVGGQFFAATLEPGPPFRVMLEEQRWLLRRRTEGE